MPNAESPLLRLIRAARTISPRIRVALDATDDDMIWRLTLSIEGVAIFFTTETGTIEDVATDALRKLQTILAKLCKKMHHEAAVPRCDDCSKEEP